MNNFALLYLFILKSGSDSIKKNPDGELWPHVQGLVRSINFAKRGLSPPKKKYIKSKVVQFGHFVGMRLCGKVAYSEKGFFGGGGVIRDFLGRWV